MIMKSLRYFVKPICLLSLDETPLALDECLCFAEQA